MDGARIGLTNPGPALTAAMACDSGTALHGIEPVGQVVVTHAGNSPSLVVDHERHSAQVDSRKVIL